MFRTMMMRRRGRRRTMPPALPSLPMNLQWRSERARRTSQRALVVVVFIPVRVVVVRGRKGNVMALGVSKSNHRPWAILLLLPVLILPTPKPLPQPTSSLCHIIIIIIIIVVVVVVVAAAGPGPVEVVVVVVIELPPPVPLPRAVRSPSIAFLTRYSSE